MAKKPMRRADNPLMISPLGRGPDQKPIYSPSNSGADKPRPGGSPSSKDQRRGG